MKKYTKEEVVELFNEYCESCYYDNNGKDDFLKSKGLIEQFEAGWYKNKYGLVYFNEDKDGLYGFDYGKWVAEKCYFDESNITKATDKEVEEALIKEWEKQGGYEGIRNVELLNGTVMSFDDIGYPLRYIVYPLRYIKGMLVAKRGECLMKDGIWAEILSSKKKMTVNEVEEELGYKIKIVE